MNSEDEIHIEHPELRLGYITEFYYRAKNARMPKQLDLLYTWFGDLFITVRDSDLTVKEAPDYADSERRIYATRYHNYLYSGGNNRITHITGRLVGTSASNKDKEKAAGEMIQKQAVRRILTEIEVLPSLLERINDLLSELSEEQGQYLHHTLYDYCLKAADYRAGQPDYDRDGELFAMDEEIFSQFIYNAMVQLLRYEREGLVYAYAWLLFGSLFRNAGGRLTRTYDSFFVPLHRVPSEDGSLIDQLRYLLFPEQYEQYYTGDDLEKRFPGIEWYCDNCFDHLNKQPGFDDHLDFWQCRKCGHINPIREDQIYENEEDRNFGTRRRTRNDMKDAIEERKKQLQKKEGK